MRAVQGAGDEAALLALGSGWAFAGGDKRCGSAAGTLCETVATSAAGFADLSIARRKTSGLA
jgi:hypothetical protein